MYRIVGICWLLSTLLCIGAITIGHVRPLPSFIPEIRECGDVLCFLDIQSGTTTVDNGVAILKNAPQLSLDANFQWRQRTSKPYYHVWLMTVNSDSNVVASTYIYIDPYEGELNVGDIVNLFGAPCRISLQEGSQMLLIYPKAPFKFQSKESLRLRLDSQLVLVLLTGAEMGKTVCDPSWCSYIWQGFRAYPQQLR